MIGRGRDIGRHWSLYGDASASRTPFRSVASVSLGAPGEVVGALDLHAADPDLAHHLVVGNFVVDDLDAGPS